MVKTETKLSEVEKAKLLVEQEKQERANEFAKKLEELCKEYNCTLVQGQIQIQPL